MYRHHKHSETALWSIKLGKLKLRLRKRPTLSSPTIYITIHVQDFIIQIHNLTALAAARKKKKQQQQSNNRLSIVSSSLKRIPWWYSLSIVKKIIKFTSALPAQLLMSGLANYVDLHIENVTVEIEQQSSLKIQQISLNSILYADVILDSIPNSIPSSPKNLQQQEFKFENLFSNQFSYQRHSLKRANHLFKEKFFEIIVQMGSISITDPSSTNMLSLPLGGNVAISCHLSAACVTLKDINVKTQINEFILHANPILNLLAQIKQKTVTTPTNPPADNTPGEKPKNTALGFFRSFTLSINNTMIEMDHENACSSSLLLQEIQVSAKSQTHALTVEPYYKLQCLLGQTAWIISKEHNKLELIRITEIKYSANVAQSLLFHKDSLSVANLDTLSNDHDMVNACWIDELGPNKNYINMNLIVHEPTLSLDLSILDMLENVKSAKSQEKNMSTTKHKQALTNKCEFLNLPRFSTSIFIQRPSIEFKHVQTGIISWSDINFEFDSNYYAQKTRPVSITRHTEKTTPAAEEDHVEFIPNPSTLQRSQTQSRSSWMNLFRRSWKPRGSSDSNEKEYTEWLYKISCNFSMQNLNITTKDNDAHFISVTNCELNAHTRLDVRFSNNSVKDLTHVIWDPDAHHGNVDVKIVKPLFNLWATVSNERKTYLEFWIKDILQSFKKSDNSRVETKGTQNTSRLSSYASIIKSSITVDDISFVLEGMDRGLKGTRTVPAGFLDNAPEKDTYARLIITLDQVQLNFSGSRILAAARQSLTNKQPNSSQSSENDNAEQPNDSDMNLPFGTVRISLRNFLIERIFKQDDDQGDWHQQDNKTNVVMWVSHINVRSEIAMHSTNGTLIIQPAIVVKKNGIRYSLTNHYAALIVVISTLANIKSVVPAKNPNASKTEKSKKLVIQRLQFQVNRSDIDLFLPSNTELYLRMDTIRGQWDNQVGTQGDMPKTVIRNLTLYGVAPRHPDKWDQLLELDNVQFSIVKDVDFNTGQLIKTNELAMAKFYMRIPYGYELSNFVDSTVTLVKAIKATHGRLLKGVPFLLFGPHEKKTPTVLPNMRLVCEYFTFQFEDDPFEARLRLIWKTGLIEQSNRTAIQEAFEIKAQTLMEQYATESKTRQDGDSIYANEEADARVNEAWQGLQEHKSKSWKRHIDASLFKEKATFSKVQNGYYRHTIITGQLDEIFAEKDEKTAYLSDMFCIDIVDLPQFPPLLDLSIKAMSLDFSPPEFNLENTRKFIFDVGKGQPVDTPLSTLIPFHLVWKSGKTWAQIRDYPVPFLLVPSPDENSTDEDIAITETTSSDSSCAWTLSGNYVVADDLGNVEATRAVHVPVVEKIYSMDIARTTTPLKFFSIVNINVHNSSLSHICWSVPYQPAIQDITRVLDTFTKPPVDPSAKIGFWDKIRLVIHTQTKISFVGGGDLAMVMKGSRDPYDLSEKGLGLAKVWRNNVIWLLGHQNPQGEFMQIISNDYAFGVPDLLQGGYTDPTIVAANHTVKDSNSSDTSERRIRQTTSMSSFNSSVVSKDKHNESRFVKIALKLSNGIRMGLGCHLERKCVLNCEICDENNDILPEARNVHKSRLLHFLPHFKVKLKAPQNVHEENYDAYRGFRSDYIHLSISIIKLTDEAHADKKNITGNSMHLTPGFLDHFVSWFRLFGGAMGYPLRAGSLFPKADSRPTQKFGRHMSTMKYKVVVNPLTVGYFLKDENVIAEELTTEELGDSVGLKGFVDGFSIDIHQRREIVNVSDYKLDQKRLKANWPVTEAEVQLNNIDLRAVKANYTHNGTDSFSSSSAENISVPIPVDNYYSDDSDNGLDMMEGLNYQCNTDSDSSDWVDLDDFIEMGVAVPNVLPTIQVLPFAFAPCIYYLRQTNRDDVQKYKYLHETHDCILGTAINTRDLQMSLLRDRSNNIDVQIRKHQARLHSIETRRLQHGEDEKSLEELSDAIVEKTRILYEKRELLQQYLKELSKQDNTESGTGDKKYDINQSRIFGKNSLEQWEELMGHFKIRYIAHNPQILWNNSIRNIVYHALDLRDHRHALSYYMTTRTMKFLRDMIEASNLEYGHNHKQFVLDDDEGGMDSSMAEELIAQLLNEKDIKFFAPNETEEEKTVDDSEIDDIDMTQSQSINDPVLQSKTIPTNYVMKSSYLVDLLNPQISLQSDCDSDNIVLVANERTQVKGFNIIDETDPDAEMELVKHRTIVSLDNLQFFVAKKEQFDSVDLLLDNHYGAKESDHWLAWIPPEMLINYVRSSDKFQRIGDRIAATLQYDKYNQLRIKSNTNTFSEVHPFEDRCDSVQLNFPKLRFTADSSQYNAIYQVATDLLLYKEPAKKERLARLREIMMAADRASLFETTEKIGELQNRARQLIQAREQYRLNIGLLDSKHIEEFKSIRLALYDTLEELYLGMEAIKLMQSNQRKDYHEPKTNLKFVFCADNVEWRMLSTGEIPLCECILTKFTFNFVSKEDHSSINTLEVDVLQVKNLSPAPVFVDVLGPFIDARKPYDFSRHKMLRCYFVSLAPVGGIPVIQHLEINLHPMRVQMTYSFGRALAYYLFPPEKPQKQAEPINMIASSSTPTTSATLASDNDNGVDRLGASDLTLTVPQSIISEKSDNLTVRSATNTNHNSSAPPSINITMASPDLQKRTVNSVKGDNSDGSPKEEAEFEITTDSTLTTNTAPVTQPTKKQKKQNLKNKLKEPDDLSVMKKRASSNRTFILVKIPGAKHCLSYQGPKEKNIEDLRDFAFEQPTLEFRNEIWSWFELASNIKKDFMKAALLHNSPALLKEKILRRHHRENNRLVEPSASIYNGPTYIPETSSVKAPTIDIESTSESSRDDLDDTIDLKDTASIHSAQTHDMWETENTEHPSKKTHLWSKFKKNKKHNGALDVVKTPSDQATLSPSFNSNTDMSVSSKNDTTAPSILPRSISAGTRHLHDNDQLTVKGRYLLGKYYNGPTQWLSSKGSKVKGASLSKNT